MRPQDLINLLQFMTPKSSDKLQQSAVNEPTLSELHQKIDAGVKFAIAQAIEKHRRLGQSITIFKDGQVVTLTADLIPPLKDNNSVEDRELIMNLSPAYIQQREVWKEEGQSLMVEKLLEARFGTLDEELKSLIPSVMQLEVSERTQLLLNLSNLSREELLRRILP